MMNLAYLSDNIDSMVTEIQLLLEQRQESDAARGTGIKDASVPDQSTFSVQHTEHIDAGCTDESGQSCLPMVSAL